jgi:hypothetical protein
LTISNELGNLVGMNPAPDTLAKKMRDLRRSLDINPEVGIAVKHHRKEVCFNIDSGRCLRPLMIVENGKDSTLKSSQKLGKLKVDKDRIKKLQRMEMVNFKSEKG